MQTVHPAVDLAADLAALVAGRDPARLAAALTDTVRLRALLPGGPIEAHGAENAAACLVALFADFDTVAVEDVSGEPVVDRQLVHYRLRVGQGSTRWLCTQTAVCSVVDGRLAVINLLCSGFRELS